MVWVRKTLPVKPSYSVITSVRVCWFFFAKCGFGQQLLLSRAVDGPHGLVGLEQLPVDPQL